MAKFLFFSQAKDITLLDECEINIPANTNVYQLWQILIENYPELKKCRSTCRLAINL